MVTVRIYSYFVVVLYYDIYRHFVNSVFVLYYERCNGNMGSKLTLYLYQLPLI